MEYITLGRTNIKVSRISLGTWSYGGASTVGENQPVGWARQDDDDSRAALIKAFEIGINHWDTADVYGDGRSEKLIGSIWNKISRDENRIIPSEEIFQTAFSLEKYLEEFIIENWDSIFPNYDLNEEEVDGKRKKLRMFCLIKRK